MKTLIINKIKKVKKMLIKNKIMKIRINSKKVINHCSKIIHGLKLQDYICLKFMKLSFLYSLDTATCLIN